VGEGFGPDAKRGRVEFVCEVWGGGNKFARSVTYLFVIFFFIFHFFFVIKSLLCLKIQKTHAALAMEIKNL